MNTAKLETFRNFTILNKALLVLIKLTLYSLPLLSNVNKHFDKVHCQMVPFYNQNRVHICGCLQFIYVFQGYKGFII